ncbi:MAG: hypothetical protein JO352_03565 [Chloroflexi bacterium]|nr:hypothetical protein [Chloroflexota bacterium]MBV9602884.1 hypothetical protein [Chloroflexota bacterium]
MTRIGIAGHQDLPHAAMDYVTTGIRRILCSYDNITGYSSLAAGADQLFAHELLAAGGRLHVVIPAVGYPETFKGDDAASYRQLLSAASEVSRLPYASPGEAAYDAAGRWIAEHSDLLIAVWDGQPARGLGGTADAVAYARELDRDVRIIWPAGLARR